MGLFSSLFLVFAALVLPIAAAVWLAVKRKGYLKPILLGVLTFFLFQVATRIPLLQIVLGKSVWFSLFSMTQPVLYALFLGATAALFEEGGRWIIMTVLMDNKHRLNDGIAFGVGHGGFEAVLLVGINALYSLITNGASSMPWLTSAGGIERVFTMVVQIAFSVMVLKSVALKRPLWLLLAFALHTFIDMGAVVMQVAGASVLLIEAAIGVFAVIMLLFVVVEYKNSRGGEIQ